MQFTMPGTEGDWMDTVFVQDTHIPQTDTLEYEER